MDWNRLPASRWGLRQLGVVLLLAAYAAGDHLVAIAPRFPQTEPPLVYFLALIAFVCGSAGCALVIHGHHLFDRAEVSERWRRPPPAVPRLAITEIVEESASAERVSASVATFPEKPAYSAFPVIKQYASHAP